MILHQPTSPRAIRPAGCRAWLLFLVCACSAFAAPAAPASPASDAIARIQNLLCFWDFQEGANGHLQSRGKYAYTLQEKNGAIEQVGGGIFGPSSLQVKKGQWLMIPRSDCPGLNLHGKQSVTIIAWVQRQNDGFWQYIAGMWNERDAKRQYALFTSGHMQSDYTTLQRTPVRFRAHGYVSDVGGATADRPYCFSYGTGKTTLEKNRWYMLAFTFDQEAIRVYCDGVLDENANANPFRWSKPIFDGGRDGSDFTVAQRALPKWPGYPAVEAPTHGEGFGGLLGGLAVFDRSITAEEMMTIYRLTLPARLPRE